MQFKAPGKVILSGEHSVVYGYPAITYSINLFKTANVELSAAIKPQIEIVQAEYDYMRVFSAGDTLGPNSKDPFSCILHACFVINKLALPTQGLKITVSSDLPTGGYGSSTALITCVVQALNYGCHWQLGQDRLITLLIDAEELMQGYRSSGMEQIAAVNAGLNLMQKQDGVMGSSAIKTELDLNFLIVESGKPGQSTGELVRHVRGNYPANADIISDIGEQTLHIQNALKSSDFEKLMQHININGLLLESLGVVSQATISLTNDLRALGAACKISGAGAISGIGSGALLVVSSNYDKIKDYLDKKSLKYMQVRPYYH